MRPSETGACRHRCHDRPRSSTALNNSSYTHRRFPTSDGRKKEKSHHLLDTGARDVKMLAIASLDRFLAQPKWEMSV